MLSPHLFFGSCCLAHCFALLVWNGSRQRGEFPKHFAFYFHDMCPCLCLFLPAVTSPTEQSGGCRQESILVGASGKKIKTSLNFFPPALHLETFSGILIIAAFSADFRNSQTQDILKGRNAKAPKAVEYTDTRGKKASDHPTTNKIV